MQTPLDVAPFHNETQCYAHFVSYDFISKAGILAIEDGGCCDMWGCTQLFERIDPNVRIIQTMSGQERDTLYYRCDQEWRAA